MKMLLIIYSGSQPHRIAELLEAHHAGGWTEFTNARGSGATGRREGTRAWPGNACMFMSIVPGERLPDLRQALRDEAAQVAPGERLHAAVLPTEEFF